MRAVWVGLVGAVLAVGSAHADPSKVCPVDAPLVAQADSGISSELAGKTFRVQKIASEWNARKREGEVQMLVSAGEQRFVVVRHLYLPADAGAYSAAATASVESAIPWGKRDRKFEANEAFAEDIAIDRGPLSSLVLKPKC